MDGKFWQRKRMEKVGMFAKFHERVRKKVEVMRWLTMEDFYPFSFLFCALLREVSFVVK